jgi:hypothetical protein
MGAAWTPLASSLVRRQTQTVRILRSWAVDELPDRWGKPANLQQSEATRFTSGARAGVSFVDGDSASKEDTVGDARVVG